MNQQQNEILIKASLGYVTTLLYFIIVGMLIMNVTNTVEHPEYAFYILAVGGAINMVAATIIIRYGNINDKDISWNITRLAVAHTPTLIALFMAMLYLFF